MNPLCPRCQAVLNSAIIGDGLTCPDCDYSYDGDVSISISGNEPRDDGPFYLR